MNELTHDEHNFLRWLLEKDRFHINTYNRVHINVILSVYQKELLDGIRSKLIALSGY